jgi:hypothetical protein
MSIIKVAPRGFDLTDTYAFTGTVSGIDAGSMVKISTQTASASSSISFTGIDSTYRTYYFKFINIHPSADDVNFLMNFSTDNGSNYNVTKTTSYFRAYHDEADTFNGLIYDTVGDLAQGTGDHQLGRGLTGDENDLNTNLELWLFNPSSTTYVKNFMSELTHSILTGGNAPYTQHIFTSGYGNTTSPINAIRFKMSSGNIDDGTITMYGIA